MVGFGLLFIGLEMMGSSLSELSNIEGFEKVVANMAKNPILAVIVGAGLTALIQSSSAFIGITQSLFASGAIDLKLALALMFWCKYRYMYNGYLSLYWWITFS